ncbi:MAG: hypothetical protein PHN39_03710 [Candidatus Pacebacteria bacterium]|nr:hypothetical protein [Candidatus Paceibacterota bacterium]
MILGHLAFSYILTQVTRLFGWELSGSEIALVMIAGSLIDLDLFVTFFIKKGISHRNFITHTPLGVFLIWLIFMVSLGQYFSFEADILVLMALLGHLVMDDSGYWLCRLGLQHIDNCSRISWLYPFKRYNNIGLMKRLGDVGGFFSDKYLKVAKASNILEVLLIIIAFSLFTYGR